MLHHLGRGKRSLLRKREAGGAVKGSIGGVTPGAEHDAQNEVLDAIDWSEDQAYAFRPRELDAREQALSLRAFVPSILREGDPVELRFETSRPAWLVVYFLEENGKGTVLWPSPEEPEPHAAPGRPAGLPSAREREQGIALTATLGPPGVAARETLVVYALADKADFDQIKPAAGASSDDGSALAAELTQRLEQVPMSRWARSIAQYQIQPR